MAATSRGRGRPFLSLLPFLVMAVAATLELVDGTGTGYLPLLSLGPAFASLSGGIRRAAAVGGLALLLCVVLAHSNDVAARQNTLTLISITGVTAAGMLASAIRRRNERELADMRTVAEAAQRVLLRPVPRRVGPIHAAVRYISAAARARIGGDLYEVVTTPKGVRIIVGDVQGKGLEAVETAAVVLGAFREAAHDEEDLHGVRVRLEKALTRHLSSDEQFVTAVLAELGSDDRVLLMNLGHPPPLLIHPDGRIEAAEPPDDTPPLGMAALSGERPPVYEVPFAPHDQLLLYTDGVIEARDPYGGFYPLAERLSELRSPDPEEVLDALQADLLRHVGAPLKDDAAMLLLRRRTH